MFPRCLLKLRRHGEKLIIHDDTQICLYATYGIGFTLLPGSVPPLPLPGAQNTAENNTDKVSAYKDQVFFWEKTNNLEVNSK